MLARFLVRKLQREAKDWQRQVKRGPTSLWAWSPSLWPARWTLRPRSDAGSGRLRRWWLGFNVRIASRMPRRRTRVLGRLRAQEFPGAGGAGVIRGGYGRTEGERAVDHLKNTTRLIERGVEVPYSGVFGRIEMAGPRYDR